MRLSEAIREGAKLRPMCRNEYFRVVGEQVCSCAIGAAAEALGAYVPPIDKADGAGRFHFRAYGSEVFAVFPELEDSPSTDFEGIAYTFGDVIADMNDSGKFTREEIADWLESCGL